MADIQFSSESVGLGIKCLSPLCFVKKSNEVMLLKEMHSRKKEMLLKVGFPSRVCSFDPIQGGAASFDPGSLYSDQQK